MISFSIKLFITQIFNKLEETPEADDKNRILFDAFSENKKVSFLK